jgi:hypothetical protein
MMASGRRMRRPAGGCMHPPEQIPSQQPVASGGFVG